MRAAIIFAAIFAAVFTMAAPTEDAFDAMENVEAVENVENVDAMVSIDSPPIFTAFHKYIVHNTRVDLHFNILSHTRDPDLKNLPHLLHDSISVVGLAALRVFEQIEEEVEQLEETDGEIRAQCIERC
ncbi:hypothetical protein ONZ45_g16421 [Pleurotus djamor]|nr:hypothetical protein ONZ45_g16421 [Pleurotus djamor]